MGPVKERKDYSLEMYGARDYLAAVLCIDTTNHAFTLA